MKKHRWAFVTACLLGIAQLLALVDSVKFFFSPNTAGRQIANFLTGNISSIVLLVATGVAAASYIKHFRDEKLNLRLIGAMLLIPAISFWVIITHFAIRFAATD